MIILGIDPGVAIVGYGIIQTGQNNAIYHKTHGCIYTAKEKVLSSRLQKIYKELFKIIKEHKPHVIVIEEVFFCRNTKTALNVGQARGVVLLASASVNKKIFQYTPLQVNNQFVVMDGQKRKKFKKK